MNFGEALDLLIKNKDSYISYKDNMKIKLGVDKNNDKVLIIESYGIRAGWFPSQSEILETDWNFYKN